MNQPTGAYVCINSVLLSLSYDIFLFWGPQWSGRDCTSQGYLISWKKKNGLPVSILLICKQTNPKPTLWTISSIWLQHSRRQYFSALIIPRPGARQLGTTSKAQTPQKWLKLTKPKLLTLSHPFLPTEATIKALVCALPWFLLHTDWSWRFSMWPWMV